MKIFPVPVLGANEDVMADATSDSLLLWAFLLPPSVPLPPLVPSTSLAPAARNTSTRSSAGTFFLVTRSIRFDISLDILVVTGAEIYLASTELDSPPTVTVSRVSDSIMPALPLLLLLDLLALLLVDLPDRALAAILRVELVLGEPRVNIPLEELVTVPPSPLRLHPIDDKTPDDLDATSISFGARVVCFASVISNLSST
mmetsp:Transcript_15514/g.33522  ORF Transcript_15514/g.33522 Transcript_15514/m.33522 type:complete len:200 (-) Transcript_15514:241-840(-)